MQVNQGFGAVRGYGVTFRKASIGAAGVLCLALVGCSAAGSGGTPAAGGGGQPVVVNATASAGSGSQSPVLAYRPLVEPFSRPGSCDMSGSTTIGMTDCVLVQVKSIDAQVNMLQRNRFDDSTTAAAKQAALSDDAHWLVHRQSSCAATATTGGTIDEITTTTRCLLKASHARIKDLQKNGD